MSWTKLKIPEGSKLFKIHHFSLMMKGDNFQIEIDECFDGVFTGHAEHSTDKNFLIESTSSGTLEDCFQALLDKIQSRTS